MSFSRLLSVRWRRLGVALAVAGGALAAVPALAQLDTSGLIDTTKYLPVLAPKLSFDRTTCDQICEENSHLCPSTDRTCGDTYITCRTQCFQGVSATPKPVITSPTTLTQIAPPQLLTAAPSAPTTAVSSGSSDLNDRIAALEALIIKYISLCQAGSCCAAAQQQVTQPLQQQSYYITNPEPAPTPTTQPTVTLSPVGTVQVPGAVSTSPQSCADCAKLAAGAAKTQCETAFKCTTQPITLVPPPPTLPTPTPAPTTPTTFTAPPAATVPGVGTLPTGTSVVPSPSIPSTSYTPSTASPTINYFTPYQSWSDTCKAACQANPLLKTQALRDQCKVDNCSVTQYKSECNAYCKANNPASVAGQCSARC